MSASDRQAKQRSGRDPRGGHVRLHWSLIDSPAWRALSGQEIALYIAMRRDLKGVGNNGDLSATLSTMRHRGFTSPATLAKSLRALQAVGLIARTRHTGGLTHGGAKCCLYRVTNEPTSAQPAKEIVAMPATNDHLVWKSIGHVRAAIKAAHEAAKRPDHFNTKAAKEKNKVQKVNHDSSKTEPQQFNSRTKPTSIGSENELMSDGGNRPQTHVVDGSAADSQSNHEDAQHGSETEPLYMLPSPVRSVDAPTEVAEPLLLIEPVLNVHSLPTSLCAQLTARLAAATSQPVASA